MTQEKKRTGPKPKLVGAVRKNVILDAASMVEALRLCPDSLSEGIRIALAETKRQNFMPAGPGEDQKKREKLESRGQQRLAD